MTDADRDAAPREGEWYADVDDALKVLRVESKHLDIDAEGMLVAEWGFKLGWRLRAAAREAARGGDRT